MIEQQCIEEICRRFDLVGYAESCGLAVKRSGPDMLVQCPFHADTDPDLRVYADGHWHCYVCHAHGADGIAFLQQRERVDFPEAVRRCAQVCGVSVTETDDGPGADERRAEAARKRGERERTLAANLWAAAWWYRRLRANDEQAAAARAYLERRGIDAPLADRFGLGLAPTGHELRDAAGPARHAQLLAAGILGRGDTDSFTYDRFRGRIVFPYQHRDREVLGFTGRDIGIDLGAAGASKAKYLNTPETESFAKRECLYGLRQAARAMRELSAAVLVEGQVDVLAAHAAGREHTVAVSGSTCSEAQARLLARHVGPGGSVVVAMDADAAGADATARSVAALAAAGLCPRVAPPPTKRPATKSEKNCEPATEDKRG